LKQTISWRGKPQVIRCDNGPENISGTIQNWAKVRYSTFHEVLGQGQKS
jgi:putative transposase